MEKNCIFLHLCLLITSCLISVDTWAKCKELLEAITTEQDSVSFFAQLIHKEVYEEFHKAEASMRCNKKGWGSDYFKYITIKCLYTEV